MPVHSFVIDDSNKRDDRLNGYSIDVETMPGFTPDIPGLVDWVQNIAMGVLEDGWTHDELLDDCVYITIVDAEAKILIDTIYNREPSDTA
ncbi:MAG: hypothetical protein GY904_06910 [Planctomycetaceae bacterium]|nr:hypothetical protein [Planctomycetaceae bacterium]